MCIRSETSKGLRILSDRQFDLPDLQIVCIKQSLSKSCRSWIFKSCRCSFFSSIFHIADMCLRIVLSVVVSYAHYHILSYNDIIPCDEDPAWLYQPLHDGLFLSDIYLRRRIHFLA